MKVLKVETIVRSFTPENQLRKIFNCNSLNVLLSYLPNIDSVINFKGFLLDVHISLFFRSLSRTSLEEGMCNPSSPRGSMPGVYTTFNKIKILLTVDIISLRVDGILFEVPGRVA